MCSTSSNHHRRVNQGYIGKTVQALTESGFYWGGISSQEAKELLKDSSVGSFLVRDSSDQRYLFTLTLKTPSGVTSVRIIMEKMTFRIDSAAQTPSFDCVVRLIQHYMKIAKNYRYQFGINGAATKDRRCLLLLYFPVLKKVPTLQHLCRRTINKATGPENLYKLPITHKLQIFLRNYPYSC